MTNSEPKLFPYDNVFPNIHKSVFLAPGVKIIGNVEIDEHSSIWFNSVVRGDIHYIKIGRETNIQDCCMLHVTNGKFPLNIGNKVTVGHSAILHGCTVEDSCLIGMGAIILDGAVIKKQSMVAAGSVIRPGFIVPTGKLAAGVPAKIVRDLHKKELTDMEEAAVGYLEYSKKTINSLKNNKRNSE